MSGPGDELNAWAAGVETRLAKIEADLAIPVPVVTPPVAGVAASVSISPQSYTLNKKNDTTKLVATVKDKNGVILNKPVKWTSTYPNAVSVDQTGLITALSSGASMINAECDGVKGESFIKTNIP